MLPKIDSPIFEINLVSQKQPVKFRPFTVKEEKILLIAEESKDDNDILNAIIQVIGNCCLSDINVSRLPLFDIEYFFLQLRSKSVSNISVLKFRDKQDQVVRDFDVDLDSIKPTIDPKHSNVVRLNDEFTVEFRYPSIDTILKIDKAATDADIVYLAHCLDKIYQNEEIYDATDSILEERIDFINSLSTKMFENIIETFVNTMPKLSYTIEYVNNENEKRKILLEGYKSFFPRR